MCCGLVRTHAACFPRGASGTYNASFNPSIGKGARPKNYHMTVLLTSVLDCHTQPAATATVTVRYKWTAMLCLWLPCRVRCGWAAMSGTPLQPPYAIRHAKCALQPRRQGTCVRCPCCANNEYNGLVSSCTGAYGLHTLLNLRWPLLQDSAECLSVCLSDCVVPALLRWFCTSGWCCQAGCVCIQYGPRRHCSGPGVHPQQGRDSECS